MAGLREAARQQWLGVTLGLLALFVALGGPATARDVARAAQQAITGKQIRDGTVSILDLSPGARQKLRGNEGPRGRRGRRGPRGPEGRPPPNVLERGDAAGGSLRGSLPNPVLRPRAVRRPQLAGGAVGLSQLSSAGDVILRFDPPSVPPNSCSPFSLRAPTARRGNLALVVASGEVGTGLYLQGGGVGDRGRVPVSVCNTRAQAADPPRIRLRVFLVD